VSKDPHFHCPMSADCLISARRFRIDWLSTGNVPFKHVNHLRIADNCQGQNRSKRICSTEDGSEVSTIFGSEMLNIFFTSSNPGVEDPNWKKVNHPANESNIRITFLTTIITHLSPFAHVPRFSLETGEDASGGTVRRLESSKGGNLGLQ
jgi:hypothetical protein